MTEHKLVALKCQSCGASLNVYADMERFACGYCGTEMLAQHRGGTVELKMVTGAIARVQMGTDKTAAELALVRYKSEYNALYIRRKRLSADRWGRVQALFGIGSCALMIAAGGGPWWTLMAGVACFWIGSLYCREPGSIAQIDARLRDLSVRIKENKAIAEI